MKIALCLSGGGVKGAAHIGALKAFEEENVKFDYLSGASSGSIVATLSAVGYSADEIYDIFKQYASKIKYIDGRAILENIKASFQKGKIFIQGLNSGMAIERIINNACKKKQITNIKEVRKNLLIPSVDLADGRVYFFSSKQKRAVYTNAITYVSDIEIGKAVRASCSYPGVFFPCDYEKRKLVDGGIRENIPWREAKANGADKVLCIVFETDRKYKMERNMIDVVAGSLNLLCQELANYEQEGADYLLKIKTKEVSLLDVKQMGYLYEMGYKQTKNFLKTCTL